ncbi:hypothetical protein [Breoghania sp. JC706]|uniref:hypothetical protein n=1 Tax=Breoghania sp. JC706 TaxID=3117732 RepID=UPI00300A5A13
MVAATTLLASTMSPLAPQQTGEMVAPRIGGIANAGTGPSIARFEVAMQQAGPLASQQVGPAGAIPSASSPAVAPLAPADGAGATYGSQPTRGGLPANFASGPDLDRQRALKGLDLDRAPVMGPDGIRATDGQGDAILDGLSRLRGAFDAQTGRLTDTSGAWMTREGQLFAVQVEIIKYSLLIDVTSKLTGKSTQTFDTLMKGQ